MVLEQMELADVKPDSATYSCLISNCGNEDQITKVIWNLYSSQGVMSPFCMQGLQAKTNILVYLVTF